MDSLTEEDIDRIEININISELAELAVKRNMSEDQIIDMIAQRLEMAGYAEAAALRLAVSDRILERVEDAMVDKRFEGQIEEAKEEELIKSSYEEEYGREPAPAYVEEAKKFIDEEGRPPTDAEMEERRRLKEMQESAHMKEGEEAGIIRRVGKQVVDFVKDKVLGWIKKRLSPPEEEVQEVAEQPSEPSEEENVE